MTKPQTLGKRIAQARRELAVRERRDVTQLDLAKAVGVSGAAVSEWEADKKVPREATLAKLADCLGVTPAFLRYGATPEVSGEMVQVGPFQIPRDAIRTFTPEELDAAQRGVAAEDAQRAAQASARKSRRRRSNGGG